MPVVLLEWHLGVYMLSIQYVLLQFQEATSVTVGVAFCILSRNMWESWLSFVISLSCFGHPAGFLYLSGFHLHFVPKLLGNFLWILSFQSAIWEIATQLLFLFLKNKQKKWVPCSPALWVTCANKCHFGDIFMFWHFFLQICCLFSFFLIFLEV